MYVVTTPGLGVTSGAPLRLGCPPEVTKVVLVPRGSAEARQTGCDRPERRLELPTPLDPRLSAE